MRPAVVKIGGSTAAHCAELAAWISAIAGASLPLVVVPGGGPFADRVRDTQQTLGFSDRAAHAMAILAMEQFGHVILDRHERLRPARSTAEIEAVLGGGRIPVWLPSAMALAAPDIPQSWNITSDSLAAWLAGELAADTLLLVKQSRAFSAGDTLAALSARGIVDAGFSAMLPAGVELRLAGPQDASTAAPLLSSGGLPGIRLAMPPARLAV